MEEQTESTVVVTDDNSANTLHNLLSEEYRGVKSLQNLKNVDDLAKSYINAQKLAGKKVEDMEASDIIALNAKLGAPTDPSQYNFDAPEDFKKKAFEAGLNHVQAKKLYEKDVNASKDSLIIRQAKEEEIVKELESTFGPNLENAMKVAQKAALELGGDDLLRAVFDETGTRDPKIIKALAEAGKRLFDHTSVGPAPVVSTEHGLDAISMEISNRMADKNFMRQLSNPGDPLHMDAKRIITKLYADKARLMGSSS